MPRALTFLPSLVTAIILPGAFFPPSLAWADGITFAESQHHYSVSIPAEWEAIPKRQLQEVEKNAAQFGTKIEYDAGFRKLQSQQAEQFPYLLIQYLNVLSVPSPDAVMKEISAAQKKLGIRSSMEYQSTLKAIFLYSETPDGLKQLTAMMLGRDRIIQLHFYASRDSFDNHTSDFHKIIESFQYKEGYEYVQSEAAKTVAQAPEYNWGHIVGSGLAAAACAVVFGPKFFKKQK